MNQTNLTSLYLQKQKIEAEIRARRQAVMEMVERTLKPDHEAFMEVRSLITKIRQSKNPQEVDELYDLFYLYIVDYNLTGN
jgi:chaperonin cofactor prefoldin